MWKFRGEYFKHLKIRFVVAAIYLRNTLGFKYAAALAANVLDKTITDYTTST